MWNNQKQEEMFMKSLIVKLVFCAITLVMPLQSWCQTMTSDPLLTGTIATSSASEQKKLKDINNAQKASIQAQAFINGSLDKIRGLQQQTYKYLTDVAGAVENARDVKRAYDYTKKIYTQCTALMKAINKNPQGLITTAVGTKRIANIKEEMVELYSYIATISLNKEVLLNTAERLVITNRVVYGLQKIYNQLYMLVYNVEALSFSDLPRLLFPDIYYSTMNKKTIAESIIKSW